MKCTYCGQVPMHFNVTAGKFVQSKRPKDTKSVVCSTCVANGALRRMRPMPEPDEVHSGMDLKEFRERYELKGTQLARYLGVHKAMISMVEKGKKQMPAGWVPKLKKLTKPGEASKWAKS